MKKKITKKNTINYNTNQEFIKKEKIKNMEKKIQKKKNKCHT